MATSDFSTTIVVDQTPQQAFDAINNVRGWWSEEIEGETDKPEGEFTYHYKDVHYCKMKIVEFIPNRKVVWLVEENAFNFIKDKSEWVGTKISFEVEPKENKTEIKFTHFGLNESYECYGVCHEAWTNYIQNSLRNLISTGEGQPNPKEGEGYNAELAKKWNLEEKSSSVDSSEETGFSTSFLVNRSAKEVFDAINNVAAWWTENLVGESHKLNDEFEVQFGEVHFSKHRLIEFKLAEKVVWLVTDSKLSFVKERDEWTNTRISFEISTKGHQTQVLFTHSGLTPAKECYQACSSVWSQYIQDSLKPLIMTGEGNPARKEEAGVAEK